MSTLERGNPYPREVTQQLLPLAQDVWVKLDEETQRDFITAIRADPDQYKYSFIGQECVAKFLHPYKETIWLSLPDDTRYDIIRAVCHLTSH